MNVKVVFLFWDTELRIPLFPLSILYFSFTGTTFRLDRPSGLSTENLRPDNYISMWYPSFREREVLKLCGLLLPRTVRINDPRSWLMSRPTQGHITKGWYPLGRTANCVLFSVNLLGNSLDTYGNFIVQKKEGHMCAGMDQTTFAHHYH